jgi:hypothetical protein
LQFSQITPFNLAKAEDREGLMKNVLEILISHVKDTIDVKGINQIKKSIRDIYQYDSTNANTPEEFSKFLLITFFSLSRCTSLCRPLLPLLDSLILVHLNNQPHLGVTS